MSAGKQQVFAAALVFALLAAFMILWPPAPDVFPAWCKVGGWDRWGKFSCMETKEQ